MIYLQHSLFSYTVCLSDGTFMDGLFEQLEYTNKSEVIKQLIYEQYDTDAHSTNLKTKIGLLDSQD